MKLYFNIRISLHIAMNPEFFYLNKMKHHPLLTINDGYVPYFKHVSTIGAKAYRS